MWVVRVSKIGCRSVSCRVSECLGLHVYVCARVCGVYVSVSVCLNVSVSVSVSLSL